MLNRESTPMDENRRGLKVSLYTPDTVRKLELAALPRFHAAIGHQLKS